MRIKIMRKTNRILVNVVLAAFVCLSLIGLAKPSYSTETRLAENLQAAEAVFAQAMPDQMMRYVAVMSLDQVTPTKPSTIAVGAAGAVLVGDRLVVRGDFRDLSSQLRDYASDPVSPPNPNITSAVHIHKGEPNKNGPFQYALTVSLNDQGTGGRFSGEYTLTPEQIQALSNGMLYLDLHTKQNRAGELRGVLRSY